jgi:hypothetical protein
MSRVNSIDIEYLIYIKLVDNIKKQIEEKNLAIISIDQMSTQRTVYRFIYTLKV